MKENIAPSHVLATQQSVQQNRRRVQTAREHREIPKLLRTANKEPAPLETKRGCTLKSKHLHHSKFLLLLFSPCVVAMLFSTFASSKQLSSKGGNTALVVQALVNPRAEMFHQPQLGTNPARAPSWPGRGSLLFPSVDVPPLLWWLWACMAL